jgi:pyruvate kinase
MQKQSVSTSPELLAELSRALCELRHSMLQLESKHAEELLAVAPQHRKGARNLLHYLAMRCVDLRPLQTSLATLGLSSLGRAETAALFSIDAVIARLSALGGMAPPDEKEPPCDLITGEELRAAHTAAVFGREPAERSVRVMITMPSEAATDETVVRTLLERGMDCMRINTAHDNPEAWLRMVQHLERARTEVSRSCSILMDLAGPKLRTGTVEPGPAVRKVRPSRDAFGRVTAPAIIWLTDHDAPVPPPSDRADACLEVDPAWLSAIRLNEEPGFIDTRGSSRRLRIVDRDRGGVWAELHKTAYLTNGLPLERRASRPGEPISSLIHGVEASEGYIPVEAGDLLVLTRDPTPGRGASYDSAYQMLSPARIGCTLPKVFSCVSAGDRVCLDDGKIVAVAESVSSEEIRARIQRAPPGGARLRADKGINLPDSDLDLPAFTDHDQEVLEFAKAHADLVGLSFVNRPSDVTELIDRLRAQSGKTPGIVLKIETQHGFSRLPSLLLCALRHDRVAVMIARGDLAVECGYERLAEAQEEILWMCEAAHCPAIWATQVLETLAKEGIPSRAEITDAAMGHRAECVMLNKGPHIVQALRVLDDILKRMEPHQSKKRAMLRALRMATDFT